ncbi:MAG TPA: glycosyltransferase family 2 protein [Candidatus Baltobacteraceae bacterium]|jgi:glycosyltransferase involved in cell wall biosynthesis
MPAQAFGERSSRVAARFPTLDAVFADVGNLKEAYPRLVERRMRGDLFYGMLLWEDPRSRLAFDVSPSLLTQFSDLDQRRAAFDALAAGTLVVSGTPVAQLTAFDAATTALAREFAEFASAQLFWSSNERERFAAQFGRRRTCTEILASPERIPDFSAVTPAEPRVVIWAPELPAAATGLLAFAFEEWRGDVFVVCAGGDAPRVRAEYLDAGDPHVGDLLSGAALVVTASLSDPGAALAFAQRNVPQLVASTSGAHEAIRGAVVYEPSQWRSVYAGALRACGRPTELRAQIGQPPPLRISVSDWSKSAPLVSAIIVTYNRQVELEGALAAVAAQTYPNIQTVVVNDGGEPVAGVCARFPHMNIKLLDRKENVKHIRAMNVGIEACDGEYICACADDDRFFPDHVERLTDALERTGALVAHTNCIAHYTKRLPEGSRVDIGFNGSVYIDGLDPTFALVATSINPTSFMMRKKLYEQIGLWDPETGYADYDIQLRMSLVSLFVHVDHFTTSWVLYDDADSFAATMVGERAHSSLRRIFDKYPAAGRPAIEQARRNLEEVVRKRQAGTKYLFLPTFYMPGFRAGEGGDSIVSI